MSECEWNPIWDDHFQVNGFDPGITTRACRVRSGNSCGSGSLVGHYRGGSLVITNAHVVGSRIGSSARCQWEFGEREGRIIMAGYSSRVTADWAILWIEGFNSVSPVLATRKRPTSADRFATTGSPSCVWPLRHQTNIRLLSNNNAGFAVWDQPAIPGQSGSAVWNQATKLQQLLLTWRTGNGNGAGQPLDFIWAQGKTAIETGALVGGALPEDAEPMGEIHPDTMEGFFCEASIRDLPIWAEDLQPEPEPEPEPEPGEPGCEVPVSRDKLIESYKRFKVEAESMLALLEIATDTTPTQPPSDGPTFGL